MSIIFLLFLNIRIIIDIKTYNIIHKFHNRMIMCMYGFNLIHLNTLFIYQENFQNFQYSGSISFPHKFQSSFKFPELAHHCYQKAQFVYVLMALYKELSVCSCRIIDGQPVFFTYFFSLLCHLYFTFVLYFHSISLFSFSSSSSDSR